MSAEVERCVLLAICAAWEDVVASGLAGDALLGWMRARLLNDPSLRSPEADALIVQIEDVIAARRDIDPALLPGSPLAVPDTAAEICPPDGGRWLEG
jgi:hypothetical protein